MNDLKRKNPEAPGFDQLKVHGNGVNGDGYDKEDNGKKQGISA